MIHETNYNKILLGFENNLKLHIVLKNNQWRNGYVVELGADYFIFNDKKNGIEPIFFLELKKVEPFMEEGRGDDKK